MKRLTYLIISVIMFNSCVQTDDDKAAKPILITEQKTNNNSVKCFSFSINAKNWKTVNSTERFVSLTIPAITEDIVNRGLVMIYLEEGEKHLALPFNYFQVRRILSFQPSYEKGHAYITIFGNFILNINENYNFIVLVISRETLSKNKKLNWKKYNDVRAVLRLP